MTIGRGSLCCQYHLKFSEGFYLAESTLLYQKLKQERKGLHRSDFALRVINTIPDAPVTVNTDCLDYVEEFTYLGSLSKNNAAKRDIRAMLAA